jgi:hypothetical protein
MKRIFRNLFIIIFLSQIFISCEDTFDSLEGDLTKLTNEDMVSSPAGIQRLLSQVYSYIPMTVFPNTGDFDATQNTDHYTMNAVASHGGDKGFTNYAFYGMNGLKTFESDDDINWSGIRAINSFINVVNLAVEKGIILEDEGNELIAEARFVRAYCYFVMVRSYGVYLSSQRSLMSIMMARGTKSSLNSRRELLKRIPGIL